MANTKPKVLAEQWVAHSRLFHVQQQTLKFSNGVERQYERLNPFHHQAVLVVPLTAGHQFVLVREYGAGIGDYYWSFPKGACDKGEHMLDSANRELQEEAGFAANTLQHLGKLMHSPSYMGNSIDIVLAQDLYEAHLLGDEPEPMLVETRSAAELQTMIEQGEFFESHAVAAFYRVKTLLGLA